MSEDSSICRWKCEDVLVDGMPTEERMLGFSNRGYPLASRFAEQLDIGQSTVIRVISAPCFLATKIEAFIDRGKGDYIVSHDLEDVIAVIDGRDPLLAEVERGDAAVRRYLAHEFRRMLSEGAFLDAIAGHLPSDSASQQPVELVGRAPSPREGLERKERGRPISAEDMERTSDAAIEARSRANAG